MLANNVRETVSAAPLTGDMLLAGKESNKYIAFSQKFTDGDSVYYLAEDGDDSELGIGTYNSTANSITRDTPLETIDSGVFDDTSPTAISLTSTTIVTIVHAAENWMHSTRVVSGSDSWYLGDITAKKYQDSISWATDRCVYVPTTISTGKIISGLSIEVTTLDAGDPVCMAGIYNTDEDGLPNRLLDSVTFTITTTGRKVVSFVSNLEIDGGQYVLVLACASATPAFKGCNIGTDSLGWFPWGINYQSGYNKYMPYETLTGGWTSLPTSPNPVLNNISHIPVIGMILV